MIVITLATPLAKEQHGAEREPQILLSAVTSSWNAKNPGGVGGDETPEELETQMCVYYVHPVMGSRGDGTSPRGCPVTLSSHITQTGSSFYGGIEKHIQPPIHRGPTTNAPSLA